MTRITRAQFLNEFQAGNISIDVRNMDPDTLKKLKAVGIDRSDLERLAGADKKISGNEYANLFGYIDGFEDGAPNDFFDTTDNQNKVTTSGEVYSALKSEFNRNVIKAQTAAFQSGSQSDIDRSKQILKTSPQVPASDPYTQHVSQVQANLKKQGLPTSAKGVSVIVIGEDAGPHGEAITRTIAGKAGLAKNADVHLQTSGGHQVTYKANHAYTRELNAKPAGSTPTITDLAKMGVVHSEATLHAATQEIRTLRGRLPGDGKTRIGSISWGISPVGVAKQMLTVVPNDSAIVRRAGMEWAMQNRTRFDPTDSTHIMFARQRVAEQIAVQMKTLQSEPGNQATLNRLKSEFQTEVTQARQRGLLIFNAAGNDREFANDVMGDPNHSKTYFDGTRGMITVGSVDLKSPKTTADDDIAPHSAEGQITIAAPGVNLPVGVNGNKTEKMNGTSFAAPYAASVAALMIAANPKITPDQIESILTSGNVTTDIAGTTRDGKGLLDPVKAVKEAKKLATP
jgi:hypothetical protein